MIAKQWEFWIIGNLQIQYVQLTAAFSSAQANEVSSIMVTGVNGTTTEEKKKKKKIDE